MHIHFYYFLIIQWHIGFYAKEYTPTYRGFDSFYGSYLGKADYWDHSNQEEFWGLDLHHNEKVKHFVIFLGSFIYYVRKILRKNNILYPLIGTRTYAYQEVSK